MGADFRRKHRVIFPCFAGTVALVFASAACADVFRCDDNGRVIYSERPCDGNATKLKISLAPAAASPAPLRTTSGIDKHIAVGMSSLAVLRAEGMPVEKNSSGEQEVWTYCRDGDYVDVTLRASVVTKITRRAASAPADSAAPLGLSASARTVSETAPVTTPVEIRKNPGSGVPADIGERAPAR